MGNLVTAEEYQNEAVGLSRRIGALTLLPIRLANLSTTLLFQGKLEEAIQQAAESLRIANELGVGNSDMSFWAYCVLSEALLHAGQYRRARQEIIRAQTSLNTIRKMWMIRGFFAVLGHLSLAESSFAEAEAAYRQSAELTGGTGQIFVGMPLAGLGYVGLSLEQLPEARRHYSDALSSALAVNSYVPIVFALPGVAWLRAIDNPVQAVEIWSLAKEHPFIARSSWLQDRVGQKLNALVASLPSDVSAEAELRGRSLDIWGTAAKLVAELAVD